MADNIKDPMEYIWEKVPKTKEGLIHYLPGDIPYLYQNGFVDTNKFTFEQWESAFDDCRQEDGSYLISHDKFLSLRQFRYAGPVFEPFDPNRVREGEWTDSDLKKLYIRSIKPSCSVPEDVYFNSIGALKKQGFVKNNNLLVNKAVKTQLKYLVDRFPSPRRKLEQEVARIREKREAEYREVTTKRDTSKFVSGKLASETKSEKLKELQTSKSKSQTSKPSKPPAGEETIDIKKLRKPRGKITG